MDKNREVINSFIKICFIEATIILMDFQCYRAAASIASILLLLEFLDFAYEAFKKHDENNENK